MSDRPSKDHNAKSRVTEPVVITVVGEPVAKGRPRVAIAGGKPRAYTPAATRKYEAHVRMAAQQAMGDRPPMNGAVAVSVIAWLPIPASWSGKRQRMAERGEIVPTKRPDCDNYLKAALDGCTGIVFGDDCQVIDARIAKSYSRLPRLEIRVAPYRAVA